MLRDTWFVRKILEKCHLSTLTARDAAIVTPYMYMYAYALSYMYDMKLGGNKIVCSFSQLPSAKLISRQYYPPYDISQMHVKQMTL